MVRDDLEPPACHRVRPSTAINSLQPWFDSNISSSMDHHCEHALNYDATTQSSGRTSRAKNIHNVVQKGRQLKAGFCLSYRDGFRVTTFSIFHPSFLLFLSHLLLFLPNAALLHFSLSHNAFRTHVYIQDKVLLDLKEIEVCDLILSYCSIGLFPLYGIHC